MSVIDEYVAGHDGRHREVMDELLALIRELVPDAEEKLSWKMPTFALNGPLIHFAAAKRHIGLYPGADGVAHFVDRLDAAGLKHSKGAIQLPFDQPLPTNLIRDIVGFREKQQRAKGKRRP